MRKRHGKSSVSTEKPQSIPIKFSFTGFEQPILDQEAISVHAAYSISHAYMWCLAANTIRLELYRLSKHVEESLYLLERASS